MRRFAIIGGLLAFVADGAYIWVLQQQGTGDGTLRAPFVIAFIAVCAVTAVLGAVVPLRAPRLLLLTFSAVGLLVMGFLGIFSIGLLLLLAAVPIAVSVGRSLVLPFPKVLPALAGGALALLVLAAGTWATELPVSCPAGGPSAGSGSGLFTGDYHWTCNNGRLTVSSGSCHTFSGSVDPSGHSSSTCN
jgi:hypothetical protein